MAGGGEPPGILTLLELIEEHRSAFEYDWRTRFGLALAAVPEVMDWGEAWRLTLELAREPESHVAAAIRETVENGRRRRPKQPALPPDQVRAVLAANAGRPQPKAGGDDGG